VIHPGMRRTRGRRSVRGQERVEATTTSPGPALTLETTAAPRAGNTDRPQPARSGHVTYGGPLPGAQPYVRKLIELAFDCQKESNNYANPLTWLPSRRILTIDSLGRTAGMGTWMIRFS
jgi:hypothetical protein